MGRPHNPHGQLAGVSDPSTPGWQERAVEAVRSSITTGAYASITYRPGPLHTALLGQAAAARDMPLTHYVRRAVAAFVAHDLGLDLVDVVATDPQVAGRNVSHRPGAPRVRDDGTGYGPWRITEVEQ